MSLYSSARKNRRTVIVLSVLFVAICSIISLAFGAISISPANALYSLFGIGEAQTELIIHKLRLPRTLLALGIGALMAIAGAMTQGLFRNPLADPSLIGISSGAAAGASIAIVLLNDVTLPLAALSLISSGAFIGGVLAVLLVYRIASGESGTSVSTMLLAGIGVTFIAGALSSTLEFIADNEMLRQISLWKMGGLDAANMTQVLFVAVILIVCLGLSPRFYSALNALLLGESEARHLGFDTDATKRYVIVIVAASVGVSVAMAGTIAFVGLVVPHIIRMLVGPNHELLVPLSACGGALLLVVSDAFARTIIAPSELPLGLVTVVIGVPIFISLLRKRHHYGMQ